MNAFTGRVFDVLEKFIVSPWNVLKVECGWRGVDPLNLDERLLESLLPKLRAHVARMTDDENAAEVDSELRRLTRPMTPVQAMPPPVPIEYDV